jgi:predicted amidophosphoribosyltransferase
MITSTQPTAIMALTQYVPRRWQRDHSDSNLLLAVKDRSPAAINHFVHRLARWQSLPQGAVICTVPSHLPSRVLPGIRQVALRLCEMGDWIDGTHCLVRVHPVPRSLGRRKDRSIERHLMSIEVRDHASIKGRSVLLLDDICTTESSLKACEQILLKAGAAVVFKCCIGRTCNNSEGDRNYGA